MNKKIVVCGLLRFARNDERGVVVYGLLRRFTPRNDEGAGVFVDCFASLAMTKNSSEELLFLLTMTKGWVCLWIASSFHSSQ